MNPDDNNTSGHLTNLLQKHWSDENSDANGSKAKPEKPLGKTDSQDQSQSMPHNKTSDKNNSINSGLSQVGSEDISNDKTDSDDSRLSPYASNNKSDLQNGPLDESQKLRKPEEFKSSQFAEPLKMSDFSLLKLVPWTLLLVFASSFFFTFEGVRGSLFGITLEYTGILRILSISGLIGYLTNWVAITMLFRPRDRRPIFGQGLIPAQKDIIVEKITLAVSKNLINPDKINEKLVSSNLLPKLVDKLQDNMYQLAENAEFREEIYHALSELLKEFVRNDESRKVLSQKILNHIENGLTSNNLEKIAFKAYKNLRGDKALEVIENSLLQLPDSIYENRHELDDFIEGLPIHIEHNRAEIEKYLIKTVNDLLNSIDISSIVRENLQNYDEGRLETLIKETTNEQLSYIKYLGGVLGVLGGLFIWNSLIAFVLLGSTAGMLLAADYLITQLKTNS
jgi:uncharacterized membrane protein YheB (UPF0754 family)